MIHLGDITKIDGKRIEPIDVIVGGSPCQDLSVAGKRAGLAGERSGLFMEQIRLTKELRQQDAERGKPDHLCRPRYFVWENVPGAFSSQKGADFAAVLEEVIRVVEPQAPDVPVPEKGWPTAGCIYDDMGRWSVAWRVHDAQFWGVPQRRRRIALVADFGGLSAPEVLFERKGLRWDPAQSGTPRQGAASDAEGSPGGASRTYNIGSYHSKTWKSDNPHSGVYETEVSKTLDALNCGYPACNQGGTAVVCGNPWDTQSERVYMGDGAWHSLNSNSSGGQSRDAIYCLQGNGIDRADTAGCNGKGWREDVCYTLNTIDRPAVYDARGNGDGETVCTITGDHENRVTGYTALCMQNTGQGWWNESQIGATLRTPSGGYSTKANLVVTYQEVTGPIMANSHPGSYTGQDAYNDMLIAGIDARNGVENGDLCGTLQAKPNGGFSCNCIHPVRINKSVRRLTPLECERLQGYQDGWTDIGEWVDSKGKRHDSSDSARYKALGNSIALPFWFWLMRRISAQYVGTPTLGSLFDGIGGFPLCWERINGKGTALWASEVEEFPIAVTKYHFGG